MFEGIFVGTTKTCSQKYLNNEFNFLADIFVVYGHDHKLMLAIINEKK